MNAREYLQQSITALSSWNTQDEIKHAEALREIDNLLRDFVEAKQRNAYAGHYTELMLRAGQLGYAEDL